MVVNKEIVNTFSALGDPVRLQIIGQLAQSSNSCNELADQFDISQQAVSKHIKVLVEAGLVTQQKKGRQRICQLQSAPLDEAVDWVQRNREIWAHRFDQLENQLAGSNINRSSAN